MRKSVAILAALALLGLSTSAMAKKVNGFALGANMNTAGVGSLDLRYALNSVEIVLGLDLDVTKLSATGSKANIQFGIDIGVFIKLLKSQFVNAGPGIYFTAGIMNNGTTTVFHPQFRVNFQVMWFPDGNNHFGLFVSADLNINIVLEKGAVFSGGSQPAGKGFGLGLNPQLTAGFAYYFN